MCSHPRKFGSTRAHDRAYPSVRKIAVRLEQGRPPQRTRAARWKYDYMLYVSVTRRSDVQNGVGADSARALPLCRGGCPESANGKSVFRALHTHTRVTQLHSRALYRGDIVPCGGEYIRSRRVNRQRILYTHTCTYLPITKNIALCSKSRGTERVCRRSRPSARPRLISFECLSCRPSD